MHQVYKSYKAPKPCPTACFFLLFKPRVSSVDSDPNSRPLFLSFSPFQPCISVLLNCPSLCINTLPTTNINISSPSFIFQSTTKALESWRLRRWGVETPTVGCVVWCTFKKNRTIVVGDLFLLFSWVIFIFIFQFHVCSKGLFFFSNFQTSFYKSWTWT